MPADTTPLSLFYCYARKDLVLRDELDAHLTGLRRSGYIATWYDGELIPGESWEQTIEYQLNTADIILLLVSPDFIKSDYCFSKEMTRAIARHTAKAAYVVPILLRPVDWTDAPFAFLQMLPSSTRAVTSWFNRDEAFEDVARGLRRTVLGLLAQRRESANLSAAPLSTDARTNQGLFGRFFKNRLQDNSQPKSVPQSENALPKFELPALNTQLEPDLTKKDMLLKPDLPCPRCNEFVPADAKYCTHCRLLLVSTESGLHLYVAPNPIDFPRTPLSTSVSPAPLPSQKIQKPPMAVAHPNTIFDKPTIVMFDESSLNTIFDKPTIVMFDESSLNTVEKVLPSLSRQGRPLSLAVGTYSDPGIKLKSKPNKDSLFAAQGPYHFHSQQAEFGFFVVADGMGGHANGQDASRRAIQTIVDYMVPRLMHRGEVSPDMLESLFQDGVLQANQAVHRKNMELHADMGTTITAALIVDATAYVCNVGDSRTYLYRQGEGLHKVTNDHSVVASLVEAGIIQPDDIYTHPKRNQIYRRLGEKLNVEVDSFRVSLQVGDKLLLCSDGLWSMVRDPKIEDVIKNPLPDPNQTASDLINAALEGGGEDNVSVIVISVTGPAKYSLNTDFRLIAKPDSVQIPPM